MKKYCKIGEILRQMNLTQYLTLKNMLYGGPLYLIKHIYTSSAQITLHEVLLPSLSCEHHVT